MSEERRSPSEEVRRMLDELGIEHADASYKRNTPITVWTSGDSTFCFVEEPTKHTGLHIEECTPEQAIAATVGRSCASCPEMDNKDSYISHLQSALKWHDEHVPRPTNPNATCVVLQGERPPEEVLFVREDGEVTHYLQERTCHMRLLENTHGSAYQNVYECDECGERVLRETCMGKSEPPKFCPNCGKKNVKED